MRYFQRIVRPSVDTEIFNLVQRDALVFWRIVVGCFVSLAGSITQVNRIEWRTYRALFSSLRTLPRGMFETPQCRLCQPTWFYWGRSRKRHGPDRLVYYFNNLTRGQESSLSPQPNAMYCNSPPRPQKALDAFGSTFACSHQCPITSIHIPGESGTSQWHFPNARPNNLKSLH
jgi:hypothetical protein